MKSKELFLNSELKTGGFYELAIQVCPSTNNYPIELYTNYIWTLENVEGPFDFEFNRIEIDANNIEHNGILHLGQWTIPFKTINIRETEPIEVGYNWFDICFYTAAIEKIFGKQYVTWNKSPNWPPILKNFLEHVMIKLFALYHFQLAMIDFEISGQYSLNYLEKEVENIFDSKFYIGKEHIEKIASSNLSSVILLNE